MNRDASSGQRRGWTAQTYSWGDIKAAFEGSTLALTADVVRHGETVTNAEDVVTGSADVPLSERGEQQARELGASLRPSYRAAFRSPLVRSKRTLDLALSGSGSRVARVYEDARIAERSRGILEGREKRFVERSAEANVAYAPPGGESYQSMAQRVLSFLVDLAAFQRAGDFIPALLCTHAGPMRIIGAATGALREVEEVVRVTYANAQMLRYVDAPLGLPEFLSL